MLLTVLGALSHAGVLVTRGLATDRLPWGNMYEFATAVVLVAGAAVTLLAGRGPALRPIRALLIGAAPLALGLIGPELYTHAQPVVAGPPVYRLGVPPD